MEARVIDIRTRERADPLSHEPSTGGSTIVAALDPSYDRLTSNNTVVLLIDHQIGPLWELEFAEPRRRVVELADIARQLRVPTIITAIGIDSLGPIIPELTAAAEGALHIVRTAVNPWDDRAARAEIEATGRRKLIIAGSAADVGVVLCARSAANSGYDVYAPIDASSQFSHAAAATLARSGVIITTTALVMKELCASRQHGSIPHQESRAGRR